MKHSTLIIAGFALAGMIGTEAFAATKWAAIVGSSDRSAVGWSTGQPTRDAAIADAKARCRKHARTPRSCNTPRKAWSGPKCYTVVMGGVGRSVCNN